MGTDARNDTTYVIGPDGHHLTLSDLPQPDTRRWVSSRKAQVVAAVDGGLLSLAEACRRYRLSREEFLSWENSLHNYGLAGLRITHSRNYRHSAVKRT